MPQLDQLSFLSQLTWLCIFYFAFHLILVDNFLPKITTILKIRRKKILSPGIGSNDHSLENEILKNYDSILSQSISQSGTSLENGIQQRSQWMDQFVAQLNSKKWKTLNISYLKRLATTKVGQGLLLKNLSTPLSEKTDFQSKYFHIKLYRSLTSLGKSTRKHPSKLKSFRDKKNLNKKINKAKGK